MTPEQLSKPLKVKKRIQETPDAVSLVLDIPAELKSQFRYSAGQFVSFFLTINGEKLSRSYSIPCSPLTDTELKITVKKVQGGKGSTFLCEHVKEGDTLLTTPPAGHFFKPLLEEKGVHYLLFACGSGITPVFSIMKTVLNAGTNNRATLVYGNRSEEMIIYKSELDALSKQFEGRLQVVHVLSKPQGAWSGMKGRIDDTIAARIADESAKSNLTRDVYLCGPTEFMNSTKKVLLDKKIPAERIHIEDFGAAVHKTQAKSAGQKVEEHWTFIGPSKVTEAPEKIVAQLNGESIEVAAKEGQSILDALLEAGAQPPYSCLDGACMACMGKIQEGRVYQTDPGILTDDNVANCEALTCQAKPLSRIVKVSYDNL